MRISDWSSDVCSSDLSWPGGHTRFGLLTNRLACAIAGPPLRLDGSCPSPETPRLPGILQDRKSVVQGKSVSVRVDLGGRRISKKKNSSILEYDYHSYLIQTTQII